MCQAPHTDRDYQEYQCAFAWSCVVHSQLLKQFICRLLTGHWHLSTTCQRDTSQSMESHHEGRRAIFFFLSSLQSLTHTHTHMFFYCFSPSKMTTPHPHPLHFLPPRESPFNKRSIKWNLIYGGRSWEQSKWKGANAECNRAAKEKRSSCLDLLQ